jgi:hypothetical protein
MNERPSWPSPRTHPLPARRAERGLASRVSLLTRSFHRFRVSQFVTAALTVRAIPPGDGPVLRCAACAKPAIPGWRRLLHACLLYRMLQRVLRGFGTGRVTPVCSLRLLKVSLPASLDGLLCWQVRNLLFGDWSTVGGGERLLWRTYRGTRSLAVTLARGRQIATARMIAGMICINAAEYRRQKASGLGGRGIRLPLC